MNTPVSRKHENETPTVFVVVEVLRSLLSYSLARHFFLNNESFIPNIQLLLWKDSYRQKR